MKLVGCNYCPGGNKPHIFFTGKILACCGLHRLYCPDIRENGIGYLLTQFHSGLYQVLSDRKSQSLGIIPDAADSVFNPYFKVQRLVISVIHKTDVQRASLSVKIPAARHPIRCRSADKNTKIREQNPQPTLETFFGIRKDLTRRIPSTGEGSIRSFTLEARLKVC